MASSACDESPFQRNNQVVQSFACPLTRCVVFLAAGTLGRTLLVLHRSKECSDHLRSDAVFNYCDVYIYILINIYIYTLHLQSYLLRFGMTEPSKPIHPSPTFSAGGTGGPGIMPAAIQFLLDINSKSEPGSCFIKSATRGRMDCGR